jgi:hypothetical protein
MARFRISGHLNKNGFLRVPGPLRKSRIKICFLRAKPLPQSPGWPRQGGRKEHRAWFLWWRVWVPRPKPSRASGIRMRPKRRLRYQPQLAGLPVFSLRFPFQMEVADRDRPRIITTLFLENLFDVADLLLYLSADLFLYAALCVVHCAFDFIFCAVFHGSPLQTGEQVEGQNNSVFGIGRKRRMRKTDCSVIPLLRDGTCDPITRFRRAPNGWSRNARRLPSTILRLTRELLYSGVGRAFSLQPPFRRLSGKCKLSTHYWTHTSAHPRSWRNTKRLSNFSKLANSDSVAFPPRLCLFNEEIPIVAVEAARRE